jgi:Ca2+-binding RTX toxin-like protein
MSPARSHGVCTIGNQWTFAILKPWRPSMKKPMNDFQNALPVLIASSTTGYVADTPDDYYLMDGETLSKKNDAAFTATDAAAGLGLTVVGTINQSNVGIYLTGDAAVGDHIYVNSAGSVFGDADGMLIDGKNDRLVNDGQVTSGSDAIHIEGTGHRITNNGTAEGDFVGIYAAGDDIVIHNNGTIDGVKGIIASSASGETLKFFNTGQLTASGAAQISNDAFTGGLGTENVVNTGQIDGNIILEEGNDHFTNKGGALTGWVAGGDGADTVFNSGQISGDVDLGTGNDVFTNHGGAVSGTIYGGKGADIYVIDDNALNIVEGVGQGFDIEKSSVSFTMANNVEEGILLGKQNLFLTGTSANEALIGNQGDNHIVGGSGKDQITGGAGDDTLTGGGKAAHGDGSRDVFIFKAHSGSDIITDFEAGTDEIDLADHGGFGSYDALKSHIHQTGNDVVIDLTDGDKITLQDMHKADLHPGDFIF